MHDENLNKRFNQKPVKVVVVGSINLDLTTFVSRFPLPGQTLSAKESDMSLGGKGFNQAVAAARAGAQVSFVGCVGDDVSGAEAKNVLKEQGVDTQFIRTASNTTTGTANILVDNKGANMIAVSSGANQLLSTKDVAGAVGAIQTADALVTQLECPMDAVEFALDAACNSDVTTVLNPAPAAANAKDAIRLADYITPNETEACELSGIESKREIQRLEIAERLRGTGAKNVVITLGGSGSFVSSSNGEHYSVPSYIVKPVNTTGAGDIFNGTFVTGIARGYTLADAVVYASAASAISVTLKGVSGSAPLHNEIVAFIAEHGDLASTFENVS